MSRRKTQSGFPFDPDYVTEPGDVLLETTEGLGITQKELAARTGFTAKHINQLIRGVARISPETALRLEKVTGVPASFWNHLETKYQERKAAHRGSSVCCCGHRMAETDSHQGAHQTRGNSKSQ
ncbi:MAG: HigA family addiction module antitoxin [Planctomycetaceae bacterium]